MRNSISSGDRSRADSPSDARAQKQIDSEERRTALAVDRTLLATERTYAAWVRTGLTALAAGIGSRALLEGLIPTWLAVTTGSLLVLFSALCFVAGVWRQVLNISPNHSDVARLPSWLLVVLNGFLSVVSLAALVGILAAGRDI
jgi:putative membrane protein